VSAVSESTTAEPLAAQNDSEPQAAKPEHEPVKPDTKKSDTKKFDLPRVRKPVDFNPKKNLKESPSSPSDGPSRATQTSVAKTDSTAASHPSGSSKPESKAAA
jgi:hypothetical protein